MRTNSRRLAFQTSADCHRRGFPRTGQGNSAEIAKCVIPDRARPSDTVTAGYRGYQASPRTVARGFGFRPPGAASLEQVLPAVLNQEFAERL